MIVERERQKFEREKHEYVTRGTAELASAGEKVQKAETERGAAISKSAQLERDRQEGQKQLDAMK